MPTPGPGPLAFTIEDAPATVLKVTGPDVQRYEVKVALLVISVVDSGLKNPLDQLPIFNVNAQPVIQMKKVTDA